MGTRAEEYYRDIQRLQSLEEKMSSVTALNTKSHSLHRPFNPKNALFQTPENIRRSSERKIHNHSKTKEKYIPSHIIN